MKKTFLILVSIILVLWGLGNVLALTPLGIQTTGLVEGSRQIVDSTTEAIDHVYEVSYAFNTPDGKHQTGSLRRKAYDVSTLPSKGNSIQVRYLSFLSQIHAAGGQNLKNSILFCGFGVLLFFVSTQMRKKGEPEL